MQSTDFAKALVSASKLVNADLAGDLRAIAEFFTAHTGKTVAAALKNAPKTAVRRAATPLEEALEHVAAIAASGSKTGGDDFDRLLQVLRAGATGAELTDQIASWKSAPKAARGRRPSGGAGLRTELVESYAHIIKTSKTARDALNIIEDVNQDRRMRKKELVALIDSVHKPTYPSRESQKKEELITRLQTPFEDIISSNHYTRMFEKGF